MSTKNPKPLRRTALAAAIGTRLRELRAEQSLSQRELAAHLGLSASRLSKYEAGLHLPPIGLLIRIAQSLVVPVDSLLTGIAPVPPLRDAALVEQMRLIGLMEDEARRHVVAMLSGMTALYWLIRRRDERRA